MVLWFEGNKVDHSAISNRIGNDVLNVDIVNDITGRGKLNVHRFFRGTVVTSSYRQQYEYEWAFGCTCVGCVKTRWWGSRILNLSEGMSARYAFVPLQLGSIRVVISAASDQLFSDRAHWIFSFSRERLTADFRPSAPKRTSQEARVPSSNRRLTGPPCLWEYDRRRLEHCILYDEGSLLRSTFWKSGRWNVIKDPEEEKDFHCQHPSFWSLFKSKLTLRN